MSLQPPTLTRLEGTLPAMALLPLDSDHLLAAGDGRLAVYDVATPTCPRLIGQLEGIASARQIAVAGRFALVTARERGLWVVDVSDLSRPRLVHRQETVELATGIAADGDLIYVAQRLYGVELLRLLPDGHLVHLSRAITDEAQSVVVTPDGCCVGDWMTGKVTRLRLTATGQLRHAGFARLDGYGDGLALVGDLLLAATGHHSQTLPPAERPGRGHGLELFRLPEHGAPIRLGGLHFPVWPETLNDFWTVRSDGQTAFCADTHNGLHLVDIRKPHAPTLLASFRLPEQDFGRRPADGSPRRLPDCVTSVALAARGVAFVSGLRTGLWLCQSPLADGTAPRRETFADQTPTVHRTLRPRPPRTLPHHRRVLAGHDIRQLWPDGDRLWVAASHDGLLLLDGGDLTLRQTFPLGCVHDVCRRGDRLYVARDLGMLELLDILPDHTLRPVARFSQPGVAIRHIHLSQDGRFALVSGGTGVSCILDLTALPDIRLAHRHAPGGIQYGDGFPEHDLDGIIPQNWHYTGLAWYDLRGDQPTLLRHDRTPRLADQIDGIGLFRGQFLLAAWGHGYLLGNQHGFRLHSVPGHQPHGIPSWDGDRTVLFSCRRNGTIQAYDFADPTHAVFLPERSLVLNGTPGRIHFSPDGRALIPAGHDGLLVEKP